MSENAITKDDLISIIRRYHLLVEAEGLTVDYRFVDLFQRAIATAQLEPIYPTAEKPTSLYTWKSHTFQLGHTALSGINSGRPRVCVRCLTCDELIHEATTGVLPMINSHVSIIERNKAEKYVDRCGGCGEPAHAGMCP